MSMRYPIPANTNPTGTKCFQVNVPNDPEWIAMFWGVLYELTYWTKFDRDTAKTGKDIARRWYDVFLDARGSECPLAIQFRQIENCVLEASFDGGLTYEPIFNSYNCALGAIADKISDGTLQRGGVSQPEAGGEVAYNSCQSYHVVLQGNTRWKSPIPVNDGYQITVSNVKGGWTDGYALGAYWQCPDGQYYSLGYCTGSYIDGYEGDPIPSLYHMRLIGHTDVYFDLYNATYVVPNGTGNQDLMLQANDSDLGDNQGSIEFDIEICNYSNPPISWYRHSGVQQIGALEYIVTGTSGSPQPYFLRNGSYCVKCIEFENIGANPVSYWDGHLCDDTVFDTGDWINRCMRSGYCAVFGQGNVQVIYRVKFELCT